MSGCADMYVNIKKSTLHSRTGLQTLLQLCFDYSTIQENWRSKGALTWCKTFSPLAIDQTNQNSGSVPKRDELPQFVADSN